MPTLLAIDPPLLNTANPWATDRADLARLYACPNTGAVTTRTALLGGFGHNADVHQYAFFDPAAHDPARGTAKGGSLNNLGYSPLTLAQYLAFVEDIVTTEPAPLAHPKGFVVSVTGTPDDVAACYRAVWALHDKLQASTKTPLAMEVNLSCPNIPNKPPPAYDGDALLAYLAAVQDATSQLPGVAVGFKTPPYTHAGQFATLVGALAKAAARAPDGLCPLSFLTATNTLGSSLVLAERDGDYVAALPNGGIGGMAGAPLHPLALGNVATLRSMLDAPANKAALGHVGIIGAGGVSDAAGYARMRHVGAVAVGVGTGLGVHGVDVFGQILASKASL